MTAKNFNDDDEDEDIDDEEEEDEDPGKYLKDPSYTYQFFSLFCQGLYFI